MKMISMTVSSLVIGSVLSSAAIAASYAPLKPGDNAVFATTAGPFVNQQTLVTVNAAQTGEVGAVYNFLGMHGVRVTSPAGSEAVYIIQEGFPDSGSAPVLFADFNKPVGTKFNVNLACTKTSRIAAKNLSLTTDAGTFSNVIRLDFTRSCVDGGLISAWFAPNVGVVQYTDSNKAGNVTTSLVNAFIKGKSYTQQGLSLSAEVPTTRFVLSAGTQYVSAVLNVKNISGKALKLNFNGDPGYDAVLLDAYGNELNRWSTPYQGFGLPPRTEALAGGAALRNALVMPLADQNGRAVTAGNYRLRLEFTATYAPSTSSMWQPKPAAIEVPLFVDGRMTTMN